MKPKYLELSSEDLAKVEARRLRDEKRKLPKEWRLVSEFGFYYGYNAIEAIRNNDIDIETFNVLLSGARKIHAQHIIDQATAICVGNMASQVKKPDETLRRGLGEFYKEVQE